MVQPDDHRYMELALDLARRAEGRTSPNPRVGAVLVREGEIVGQGFHLGPGHPHAEAEALRHAGERARGATLYVTLEPCCHHGHTPPCTDAVIAAGVRRVVTPLEDPNPIVAGQGLRVLREAGIEVERGPMQAEAEELNAPYLTWRRLGRPLVTAKWAGALCGHVAAYTGESRYLTGEDALREVHRMRAEADAVMVGVGTVRADDPELTVRFVPGENPVRVVIDSRLRTPPEARLLHQNGRVIIFCGRSAPEDRRLALADLAEIIPLPGDGRLPLEDALRELARRDITSVLAEGGPRLFGSLFDGGLVDRVAAFFAPLVLGGKDSPAAVLGQGVASPGGALRFRDRRWQPFGNDMCFFGTVLRSDG